MAIDFLRNNIKLRPKNCRLLGMDIGSKTIGLAVCDPDQNLATPLKTIGRTKFTNDILKLQVVIRDYEIGGFVIGLPLNDDGSEGRRAQSIRDFALEMLKHPEVFGEDPWISFQDERFSTQTAENFINEELNIRKAKAKNKGLIDRLAAQTILQGALDMMNNH